MDNMDFATHDNTPGPPAHANAIPQSSGGWGAQQPAMMAPWTYRTHPYPSQWNSTNPAISNHHLASLPSGPYPGTGVPDVSQTPANMAQYQTTAGIWPPAAVPQHSNTYTAHTFASAPNPTGFPMHYPSTGASIPPGAPQPQLGFAQQAAFTNRQSPFGTVNTQLRSNSQVGQQSEHTMPYYPGAAPYAMHTRHNSQPNPYQQRNVQNRSRPSQYHRYTHSTSTLNPNIVNDRIVSSPSPAERRRQEHTRGRRPASTRFTVSESRGDWARQFGGSPVFYPGHRQTNMSHTGSPEEGETRRLQVFRSAPTSRCVVSKAALQSLQSVELEDLPESERTCVICYNDYDTLSPEGFRERPVRLPKCKHVFGSHCIRKWFQDSDSCPYCRDKLQSEPKHLPSSTRAFLDMMRIRGWAVGSEVAEDFYRRIMAGEDVRALVSVSQRRPPPTDGDYDDSSRRTRRRRSSSSSVEPEISSPIQNTASPYRARHGIAPNSSGQAAVTQAGAASTPWMFMAPGSPGSNSQNASLRYQSPARPASQSTVVHQPNSALAPPVVAHGTYTGHLGPAASRIPNPLQNSTRESRVLHAASEDWYMDEFLEDMYSSEEEAA